MTLPKIEEWIKEVEERPGSALTILKLIAGRLRDLTERNEELLAENIALQDGSRVEEYRKRIAHLEYQLDLLKRRLGLNQAATGCTGSGTRRSAALPAGLQRPRTHPADRTHPRNRRPGHLGGELSAGGEAPRLLAVPANEELLLLFSSGRVSTCPVEDIPVQPGGGWDLDQAALPDEPHAGERLACLMPLSGLALADFFLQTSRRGCVKKTMTSMAETVLRKPLPRQGRHPENGPAAGPDPVPEKRAFCPGHPGRAACSAWRWTSCPIPSRNGSSWRRPIMWWPASPSGRRNCCCA